MVNVKSPLEPEPHPDDHVLQQLATGDLGPANADKVLAHLDSCAACQGRFGTINLNKDRSKGHSPQAQEQSPSDLFVDDTAGTCETADIPLRSLAGTVSHVPVPARECLSPGTTTGVTALEVGCTIGGFRLLNVLGEGGFGTVYRAEDAQLRRKVALKVLRPRAMSQPDAQDRFLSEARALAAIHHDHVVPIYEVGSAKGHLFIAMPLLAGETLAARLEREGALPANEVRRIGRETAAGLAAIHAKGLIHRDLKPANIWLETGTNRVKVLDLGLAQDAQHADESTAGTPAYMSPEQAMSRDLDFRSDLFSLGSVLYECATGRQAFKRDTIADTLDAVREELAPISSQLNPGIPRDLSAVIELLHQKDPAARPISARALGELLQEIVTPVPATNERAMVGAWLTGAVGLLIMIAGLVWQFVPAIPAVPSAKPSGAPAGTEDLRIIAFDITHFAREPGGASVENRGVFGKSTWIARQRDLVTLNLTLTRPAYTYLIAFRPDGVIELCYPENEQTRPSLAASAKYPSLAESRSKGYGLSESPGLWVFTAVVSESPLPPFQEWQQRHSLPTQTQTSGLADAVLVDDGTTIDQLQPLGGNRLSRGKGEDIPGQQAIETIDDALKQVAPKALLRSIGIVATPGD